MSQALHFDAELRRETGTGPTRALRRMGRVPAVVYGGNAPSQTITLEARALARASQKRAFMTSMEVIKRAFMTSMVTIKVADKEIQVLVRDLQRNVVTGVPIHADLLRVTPTTEIEVEVPVIFLNNDICPGIKMGGVLNVVRRTLEVRCQVALIPDQVEVDLVDVHAGQSIHMSAVTLPDGVVPTITDRDFTIAAMTAPSAMTDDEDEEGEGTPGEEAETQEKTEDS